MKQITLSDGRSGLRSLLPVEIREPAPVGPVPSPGASPSLQHSTTPSPPSPGEDSPLRDNSCNSCLDFIASNDALDRCEEIIEPAGWRLENYRRNPVFQNAHQYGDIIFTLGKALITEIRSSSPLPSQQSTNPSIHQSSFLFQRIQFATDVNPMARIAYGLYKGKFLNAVSVGFIPIRWLDADGRIHDVGRGNPALPGQTARGPRGEDGEPAPRRRYLEQELLEVSAVGIPANPDALALGLKSGAVEKPDLRELAELIHHTLSTTPPLHHSNTPSLIHFARDLRDILRHS